MTDRRPHPHAPRRPPRRAGRPQARIAHPAPRPLHPGQRLSLTFTAFDLDGSAVATADRQRIAVPFAVPGEEAVVEITRGGRRPEGRIVSLLRKSAQTEPPRCRHFGRCGGCQWQHLRYQAQLAAKTELVRSTLAPILSPTRPVVGDAVGAALWAYRNRIEATFDVRQDRLVAGYYAREDPGGGRVIINVQECPIQHPGNVRLLHAARDVVDALGWAVYDRATGKGLVRGMIGQTGFRSGEAMLVLSVTREVPDRMALVRAVRDRVPNLVSLMLSVQPRHTPELLGRCRLLWGRPYLEDEIAGLRVRLYAAAAAPPNPAALPLWLDAIGRAAAPTGREVVLDAAAEDGLLALSLARRTARVFGVAPDREAMRRAWEAAHHNGIENAVFYTRSPAGVLGKLRARGERVDAVVVTSRGRPADPALFAAAAAAGVGRLVCASHSLTLLAADLRAAAAAGYAVIGLQPVDLLPQTSRIHCVAALARA